MSPARALRTFVLPPLALLFALAASGCGADQNQNADRPELVVSAAASLKSAFTNYAADFNSATVKPSFAGSDELAAQIESGLRPDVFAAANTKLPEQLYAKGLVRKPVVFAGNKLVIAVPADSSKVKSLDDLSAKGLTIAAGSPSVPVGAYTRKVLAELPAAQRDAITANIRSEEPNVSGVVGKLTQGAVDAGFVYVTDVEATDGKLRTIELPAAISPVVAYGIAQVVGAEHPQEAQAFIDGLINGSGKKQLTAAGFAPSPK